MQFCKNIQFSKHHDFNLNSFQWRILPLRVIQSRSESDFKRLPIKNIGQINTVMMTESSEQHPLAPPVRPQNTDIGWPLKHLNPKNALVYFSRTSYL